MRLLLRDERSVEREGCYIRIWSGSCEHETDKGGSDKYLCDTCRLQTSAGKKVYAERKVTSEPVYGIIKEVMGFRRFLVRGFEAVQGEWNLVCMAYNIKKLVALSIGDLPNALRFDNG